MSEYREQYLQYLYDLSVDEYELMLRQQEYRCAICKRHISKLTKRLAVDHCHKSKNIRGLLCSRCNIGLGMFVDDIKLLSRAIVYLEDAKEKNK
jgi:DNA-directed RNA polymerase subunit RPC12/RpoP